MLVRLQFWLLYNEYAPTRKTFNRVAIIGPFYSF